MNPPARQIFFPRGLEVIESVQECRGDSSCEDVSCHGNAVSHGFWSCRNYALFLTDLGALWSLGMLVPELLGILPLTRLI